MLFPHHILGPGYFSYFLRMGWPIVVLLLLFTIAVNIIFFSNYKLLILLEKEDWPAIAYYLEEKIYTKNQYNSKKIRLLANSYMVMSDFQSVSKLESKVLAIKPAIVSNNALVFGIAKVLNGDHKNAADFFKTCLYDGKVKERQWVHWFYGFALLLTSNFDQAEAEFKVLAAASNDVLIVGLSSYFLATVLEKRSYKPDECRAIYESGKEQVVKTVKSLENWKKEGNKAVTEIYMIIIRKYMEEAGSWLFK